MSGISNEIYNASNDNTYCSIFEMAMLVSERCANEGKVHVIYEEEDASKYGYAKELKMNLDSSKLKSLGWNANVNLEDMYKRLIRTMEK